MIQAEPVGFWNTFVPVGLLAVLAVAVPWMLVRRETRSHVEVAVAIWASAGVMLILSGLVFAVIYGLQGARVWGVFLEAPLATAWFFLKAAGYAAILWVPILGLVWFGMAQGVERRRGEDQMRR